MSPPVNLSPSAYLKDHPSAGRGVFASGTIPAGTEILSVADPLICIPDEAHLDSCCHYCMAEATDEASSVNQAYRPPVKLSYCLGCRVVKYCSKACQTTDWKQKAHKYECVIYKAQYPRILPVTARAILRMAKQFLSETPGSNIVGGVGALKAHAEDFAKIGGDRWEMANLTAKAAAEFSKVSKQISFEPEFLRDMYCKLLINSASVVTQTFDPIGLCLAYQSAMFNHSCDPNAVMMFDGRQLSIRSLKEITKDTEITISYIDNLASRKERKEELKSRYFFDCSCSLCSSGVQPLESLQCPKCKGLITTNTTTCTNCGEGVTEDELTAAIALSTSITTQRTKKKADKSIALTLKSLKQLYGTRVLPSTFPPIPQLHRDLATSYIDEGNWKSAFLHLLTPYVKVYPNMYATPYHPVRIVGTFTLAMVLIQVAVDEPEGFGERIDFTKVLYGLLTEVCGNVEKSHGGNSSFAEMASRKMEEVKLDVGIDSNREADKWMGKGLRAIPGLEGEVAKLIKIVDEFLDTLNSD
ncbi:hypothetical protein TWF569_008562 [Orbilia oligospora]|nr:hypothetical protein TWF706_011404 [Orbilia oligospora]KAF3139309.1 hypothetical protein TWF569_008562 [Orbilia oligospora]